MHAASITRHHTLPAGLPTHSASTNHLNVSPSEPADVSGTDVPETADTAHVKATDTGAQETQIRTVSSVTSFLTGSPLVRSPLNMDGQAPVFHFSPPITPGVPTQLPASYVQHSPHMGNTCMPETSPYSDYISRDASQDNGSRIPAQYQPIHYPYTQFSSAISTTAFSTSNPHQPVTYLSPFCASPAFIPQASANVIPGARHASTSAHSNQSNPTMGTPRPLQPTTDGHMSVSPAQLYTEASHDSLIQEITRLRERLKSVESENAMMAAKLNQQQWELEHRLSELEMHMTCTSDMASTGSTDDRSNPFENISRESII